MLRICLSTYGVCGFDKTPNKINNKVFLETTDIAVATPIDSSAHGEVLLRELIYRRLDSVQLDLCRIYRDEEKLERTEHLNCDCSTFCIKRLNTLV